MSFDLGVRHSEGPLSDKETAEIYTHLCQEWPYLRGESPSVAAFYEDLTARRPELDTISGRQDRR